MKFATVCSGIGAPEVAFRSLGWEAVFCAEIERFPSAVLAHHFPTVPNLGDFTKIGDEYRGAIDVLVGGTPCQDFSVAGLRAGMDGKRGQLTIEFARLAGRLRPGWLVWENVPGVLSSDGGRAFGIFIGLLGQLGYGLAYRILDAQYLGVAQRRRRVFVVGCLGDWRRAAAVLFERHSLSGHPAPRREAGQRITQSVAVCLGGSSQSGGFRTTDLDNQGAFIPVASTGEIAHCLNAGGMGRQDYETETLIAHSLRADGFDASEDGTGRGTPIIPILEAGARTGKSTDDPRAGIGIGRDGDPMFTLQSGQQHAIAFSAKDHGADAMENCSPTLRASGHTSSHANAGVMPAVAIRTAQTSANGHGVAEDVSHTIDIAQGQAVCFESRYARNGRGAPSELVPPRKAQSGVVVLDSQLNADVDRVGPLTIGSRSGGGQPARVMAQMAVRRLTPRECERLQGFPDDFTLISYRDKPAPDGPRYKALGNSMAVPVMRWIGGRIQMVKARRFGGLDE